MNKINKLKEKGLLDETEVIVGEKAYPAYIFPYDYSGKYKIIDKEMLNYLVHTRNS